MFVIAEQPHPTFTREGNDLVYTHRIGLLDALTGGTLRLQHLDGRQLTLPFGALATPNSMKVRGNP